VLQCVACVAHCIPHMGEGVAVRCSVLQCVAVAVSSCVAVCCSVLQRVAHCIPHMGECVAVLQLQCLTPLQGVVVCCSVLHIVFCTWVRPGTQSNESYLATYVT